MVFGQAIDCLSTLIDVKQRSTPSSDYNVSAPSARVECLQSSLYRLLGGVDMFMSGSSDFIDGKWQWLASPKRRGPRVVYCKGALVNTRLKHRATRETSGID